MKEIKLTNDGIAIVNNEDYEKLNKIQWRKDSGGYAIHSIHLGKGKYKTLWMHRLIINTPEGMQTDHINGNRLDNRKSNLRICNNQQNHFNMRLKKTAKGKFKGIIKKGNKWVARIWHNYENIYLGIFNSELEAAEAYDKKAKELFGEFAKTNFPLTNFPK